MEILKKYYIKKRIADNLKRTEKHLSRLDKIVKIGVIVDMDTIKNTTPLQELISFYHIRPENAILLGYRKNSEKTHLDGVPFFIDKEINWKGVIRNYHADRLCEQEYDLLINYFDSAKLPLLLLSSAVKSKLKIGFESVGSRFNDIMIHCKLEDEEIFTKEVKKIIKTILNP